MSYKCCEEQGAMSVSVRCMSRKLSCAFLSAALVFASVVAVSPASAWWIFHKKKSADGEGTKPARKKRELAATAVGLIAGNPPALFWKPSGQSKAALLCLHELGLYNGVFDDLGKRMSAQGVAVYAIDLRGFGAWRDVKGAEGRMDLDKTLADVKGSVEVIHKLNPDVPVFVLGEAMGGALALKAASTFPQLIQGAISAAPGGEHYKTAKNYMAVAGKIMSGGPNGDSGMAEDLMEMATPKKELREAFQTDQMVRLDLKPRELMDCQFFMYKTKKFAHDIKNTPVLIVHGKNDGESRAEGSTRVYERLATKDKRMLTVDDGDHYVFEDTKVSDKAMDSTLAWIDEHLKPAIKQP